MYWCVAAWAVEPSAPKRLVAAKTKLATMRMGYSPYCTLNCCRIVGKYMTLRLFCQAVAVVFLIAASYFGPAVATDTKDQKRERQALRRMQQQLTEIQQQKSAVDQEKTVLEDALKKTQKETQNEIDIHKRSTASAATKAHQLEKEIETANSEKAELRARLDEAEKQNKAVSAQRDQWEQD